MQKEAADPARGDHDAVRFQEHGAIETRGNEACYGTVFDAQATRAEAFDQADRGRRADRPRQGADDLAPGCVTAGMDDALASMRGLEPQQQGAVRAAIELHVEAFE